MNSDSVSSATLTSSGTASTATVAGGPYAIVPSAALGSGLSNYTISYVNGALTVNPAPLTVTAQDQSKTYGQNTNLGNSAFTVSGLLNADAVGTVTLSSTGSAPTATVAGGPYAIVPSAAQGSGLSNYAISYANGALTVDPAPVTVTALGGSSTYGSSPANPGLSAVGLQNGQNASVLSGLSNSFGISGATTVGNYTLSVVGALTNSNYTLTGTNTGSWVVDPASLTITAQNETKTYGQSANLGNSAFIVLGLKNSDSVSSVTLMSGGSVATATVAGGPYAIVPSSAFGTGLSNYTISYANGALTVAPAPLTIMAHNQTKTYGQSANLGNSAFSVSGLVNSDSVGSVTLTSGGAGSLATVTGGPYAILPAAAQGSGLSNYAVSYVNGLLTVNPAALTITAQNQTKTYGQNANLGTSAVTVSGRKNSDSVSSVTLTSSGSASTASVAGGPYAILPSSAVGTALSNYTINYLTGSLTIDPAPVVVSAISGSSTEGNSPANPGLSAIGLQNGQGIGVLSGLSNSFGINSASAPGTYTLIVGGTLNNPNYVVTSTASGDWVVVPLKAVLRDWPSQTFMSARTTSYLCASDETPRLAESVEFPNVTVTEQRLDLLCIR